MRVTITRDDIRRGTRRSPFSCPIARALKREHGIIAGVGITSVETLQPISKWKLRAELSLKAERFVNDFDEGKPVKPFTTVLTFKDYRG